LKALLLDEATCEWPLNRNVARVSDMVNERVLFDPRLKFPETKSHGDSGGS